MIVHEQALPVELGTTNQQILHPGSGHFRDFFASAAHKSRFLRPSAYVLHAAAAEQKWNTVTKIRPILVA